ncbi:aminotransferase class I/II-fold pyridoxal phosphate-dependent enzyme [Mycobacteroides abscessus]|uniref:aminotransferase class I/II-fold pyridoxal phosphate-dependent enzyme n=1 Tax=Mycobacteroides abscessus TaxID=36809 RepID=UPI000E693068|nr:aminotransferase class I/II-fold pyridoxal phosphate-dependent enzyme [Mycobacteroides abscessus]RIU03236.1 aminotransferase class I/II-fold pyridoxal phosphate-dependent enzyme [Mycobacteroides abscessus]
MTSISGTTASAIASSIRDLVLRGDFAPGHVLPPIRALASELGVNRNTVAAAYQQLVTAGVAQARGRLGTAIASVPELDAEHLHEPGLIDLASGNPDPDLLPDLQRAISEMPYRAPLYGASAITENLIAVAESIFASDVGDRSAISVTHGAVDAVERVLNSSLTRGDAVAVEDPCFLASIGTIRLNGYRRAPVPLDEYGMTPAGLRQAINSDGARAVIITPRAHNPTGVSVSAERAKELRSVLANHPEVLVIEDDYFSAVSSSPYFRVTPASTNHWALVRSVAKFLGPDLRLAVVASNTQTAQLLTARLRGGKTWVSHLQQEAAAYLLTDRPTLKTLSRAQKLYAERIAVLSNALAAQGVSTFGVPDGLNLWIDLPGADDVDRIVAHLAQARWAVQSSQLFAADPYRPRHGIRVTSATVDRRTATDFAAQLSSVL